MEKVKLVGYMSEEEKQYLVERAKQLGMTIGAYLIELTMWDRRFSLIPQLRKGGIIVCNGKEKT